MFITNGTQIALHITSVADDKAVDEWTVNMSIDLADIEAGDTAKLQAKLLKVLATSARAVRASLNNAALTAATAGDSIVCRHKRIRPGDAANAPGHGNDGVSIVAE